MGQKVSEEDPTPGALYQPVQAVAPIKSGFSPRLFLGGMSSSSWYLSTRRSELAQCPHLSEIMAGKEVGQAPVPPE